MDPHHLSPTLELLSYVHPAIAAVGLGLSLYSLRVGFQQRDFRVRRVVPPKGTLARHLRYSQPAALVLAVGFGLGAISSFALRGWVPFTHFHGWAGVAAMGLFGWTWWMGRGLKTKQHRRSQLHGIVATLALLAGALSAVTGIELLP